MIAVVFSKRSPSITTRLTSPSFCAGQSAYITLYSDSLFVSLNASRSYTEHLSPFKVTSKFNDKCVPTMSKVEISEAVIVENDS